MVSALSPISSPARPERLWVWPLLLVVGVLLCSRPPLAAAQASLRAVNGETTVRKISFRFVDHKTFDTDRLLQQIATSAPGTLDRVRSVFDFLPGIRARRFPFSPVTLQKDVVRLRRFYQQNGFPNPEVDYPASQLDTTRNAIHVIFTIREGSALTIRNTDFLNADGTAATETTLDGDLRAAWRTFRDEELSLGGRYTDFKRQQIEDQLQSWFRHRGFAFAEVRSTPEVDTTQNAVDLQFFTDPGPRGAVSEIQIEGTESVDPSIIRRELPFSVGDRFSADAVTRGQQNLFDLNLFRVALADVPDQPRDSTVVVRYRVREAKLRRVSGQGGYDTQSGLTLEGSWRHQNFLGNARTFIFGLVAETGLPENPPAFVPSFLTRTSAQEVSRRFRVSATLRQPHLFTSRLTGSLAPFAQERLNPALSPNPNRRLDLNERQYGVNSNLEFDVLPFRTVALQHALVRTQQFLSTVRRDETQSDSLLATEEDLFDKSVFSLNGTFGRADDYVRPSKGYLFRPTLQLGGFLIESGVEFVRVNTEVSGYLPISNGFELAGRLFAGSLWPLEESRDNLVLPSLPSEDALRQNRLYQNRFSDYLFYAGGGSDVRGWASRLAGGKVVRESPVLREQFVYRPVGARAKVGGNLEARFPFPGLGSNWRTAAFVDAAYLTAGDLTLIPSSLVPTIVPGPEGEAVSTDPSQLVVGSGVGLRYQTPFGFLRVDLAYKVTPDALDLRSAQDVGQTMMSGTPVPLSEIPTRRLRRFRFHFGIGRSF